MTWMKNNNYQLCNLALGVGGLSDPTPTNAPSKKPCFEFFGFNETQP